MEVLARKKAEQEVAALQRRLAAVEEIEERIAHESQNGGIISQNGSNLRHHVSRRSEEQVDEAHHDAYIEEDEASDHSNEGEYMLVNRHVTPPEEVQQHQESPVSATPAVQPHWCSPVSAAPSAIPRNDAPRSPHDDLVGKDVILYALLRSEQSVAKGTIISTNPKSMLGGDALGKQYCEVVVTTVLKRDTVLPRSYGDVQTMVDGHKMSIAWPYKRLKVTKASQSAQGSVGGRS